MKRETVHHMRLRPGPFAKIQNGTKTIEIRLNDEKRRRLLPGDEIVFSLIDNPERQIRTKVLALQTFASFQELFSVLSPREYGGESEDEYTDMYQYYTKEDEFTYGVLAIKIVLVTE